MAFEVVYASNAIPKTIGGLFGKAKYIKTFKVKFELTQRFTA